MAAKTKMATKLKMAANRGQNEWKRSYLTVLQVMFKVKGQGQRSRGSRSKVKWVKLGLKVMIMAGGLTSTSSCIFMFDLDL